jgi:hypothetical protein
MLRSKLNYTIPAIATIEEEQKQQKQSKEKEREERKKSIINFCLVYGCGHGGEIASDSKFIYDIIALFRANFHAVGNYIDIPSVYNQVEDTDCNFEIATSNLGQQLKLQRANDVVGPKIILYAFDQSRDKAMAETRRLF